MAVDCEPAKASESQAKATQRRLRLAKETTEVLTNDKIVNRGHGTLTVKYFWKDGVLELVEVDDLARIK